MTALFTVWREGIATSCGRSCYNAKHQACRCPICGGLNHGKGPEVAAAITRRHLDEWIAAVGEGAEVELDPSVQQDPLFTIGARMHVALTDRNGTEVTVRPLPGLADTFALLVVGDQAAKLDADQARQVRDGLTDWLAEIGADNP